VIDLAPRANQHPRANGNLPRENHSVNPAWLTAARRIILSARRPPSSCAVGGAGTAAALETADVALMGDDLSKLPFAVGLSRQARGVIRQNLYVSLGVIAFLLVSTVTGFFGIGLTVIVHEGSTLVVIANALRLLVYKGEVSPR
jgi:hypothetical protein